MEEDLHALKKKIAIEAVRIEFLLYQLANSQKLPKEEIEKRLQKIKESLFYISEDAVKSVQLTTLQLFWKRFVPLLLTAIIGLGVACVLSFYDTVIAKFAAIYVLSPLVSALSGNYGLQVASKEIRTIAVGLEGKLIQLVIKECGAAILTGLSLGTLLGIIGMLLTNSYLALPVLVTSLTAGILTASLMGCLMPYLFHRLGFDPTFLVGPFETSLQDLVSYFTFVLSLIFFSKILL